MSKHSASAVTEPVPPKAISSAVEFHPFSVSKGSKDLIIAEPLVTKLPLSTVSPASQRATEDIVNGVGIGITRSTRPLFGVPAVVVLPTTI